MPPHAAISAFNYLRAVQADDVDTAREFAGAEPQMPELLVDVAERIVVPVTALPGPEAGEPCADTFALEALGRVFVTSMRTSRATRQSGTSIQGEHAPRGGNRQLKRAMFLYAFAALHDPASRAYYGRCRALGKTHTQALLRLARHRISVLFAMLHDGTFYQPRSPQLA